MKNNHMHVILLNSMINMRSFAICFSFVAVLALIGAASMNAIANSGIIVISAYAKDKADPCRNANDIGCGGGGGGGITIGAPQPNLVNIPA
jgi:hypothetical protein